MVAGQLQLLLLLRLAKGIAVIRILFYGEDEEGGEDEGKTVGRRGRVPESRGERRRRGEARVDDRGQE